MAVLNAPQISTQPNPFPGLRPFGFDDSLLFFGRDGQSEELIRKLAVTHFLAVVGISGSGKSSLVRAGLWPALLGGFMVNAGSDWRIATMRPSNDPIGNLAASLNSLDVLGSPDETEREFQTAVTEASLRRGSLGLIEAVRQGRMEPHESLLLVVDQFEELFRFERVARTEEYHNDAAAFVKLLLEAARQRDVPIYVVMTMRSDFLGDCSIFWDLPEAINEGQYLIPRMTRDELRETITGPVAVFEAKITQRLLNRLLNDLEHTPDHLPILQHALMRTWDNWKKDDHPDESIDLRHYEAIGTMTEALSQHADEAYDELADERSRQVAERIFKGLTEKGPDNREVRRPTELKELCALAEASESETVAVVETFRKEGRSFLMPPAGVPLHGDSLIDVSHESLIRNWRRLKQWVDEEARSARTYRRLAETAVLHEAGEEGLLKDPALQVALQWRDSNHPNKTWADRYHAGFDTALSFLDKSVAGRKLEEEERESRRAAELRYKRILRIAAALGALLVIALVAGGYALQQRRRADRSSYRTSMKFAAAIADFSQVRELLKTWSSESAFRGFEWYYLWRLVHTERNTLKCASRVCVVALSPNGGMLANGADNAIELWDLSSMTKVKTIEGDTKDVGSVVFSPDGKILGVVTQWNTPNRSLKLFDVASSEQLPSPDVGSVRAVAFSPEGRLLATVTQPPDETSIGFNDVMLWDLVSRREIAKLPTRSTNILALAFSPDGRTVAGLGRFGEVVLWDLFTHKEQATIPGQAIDASKYTNSIAFSPNGKMLAASNREGVKLWDAPTYNAPFSYFSRDDDASVIAFSADGKMLAIGFEDGDLKILDTATKEELETFRSHESAINYLAFSRDGRMLVSASFDGSIKLWDAQRIREEAPLIGHKYLVNSVTFSADGTTIATGSSDKTAKLWDAKTGQLHATLEGHSAFVRSIAFSPDGKLLATGGGDKTVRLWDIRTSDSADVWQTVDRVNSVAFSPDGKQLVIGTADGTITLWNIGSKKQVTAVQIAGAEVKCVTFSPDGKMIAAAFSDGAVRVWDGALSKERNLSLDSPNADSANSLAFSPDGGKLAAGFGDGLVHVWETGTFQEPVRLTRHVSAVSSVAFSPDNKRLVSSGFDGNIVLWDVDSLGESSGLDLLILKSGSTVYSLAFSPDGRTLIAGGLKTVKMWQAASPEEVAISKSESDAFNSR